MSDEEDVCSQEVRNAVKGVVQTIMMLDYNKKPIKRSDIVSHLAQKPSKKNWNEIFDKARRSLQNLGLELIDVKDSSAKSFFVVSKHRPLRNMHKYAAQEEVSNRILLTLVLAYVLMKNGMVESGDLLNHLRDLNIYNDDELQHPYFGNVKKKLFAEFVDQLYLSCRKIPDSDFCEISWGQRAEVEISKKSILKFVCKCGFDGKIRPRSLLPHSEEIEEQEADADSCADRADSPVLFVPSKK